MYSEFSDVRRDDVRNFGMDYEFGFFSGKYHGYQIDITVSIEGTVSLNISNEYGEKFYENIRTEFNVDPKVDIEEAMNSGKIDVFIGIAVMMIQQAEKTERDLKEMIG